MVNLSTVLHVLVFISWYSCGFSSHPAYSSVKADGRLVSYHRSLKRDPSTLYSSNGQRQLTNTYTRCPPGFVFPEHPNDPDVEWINGTNCALGCKSPVIDAETWESADQLGNGVNFIAFVSIVFLFITFWLVPRGATSLVLISSTMSFIPTFVQFVQHRRTFTERFCRDNAIPISAADGITGCNIESFTTIYCAMALALSWMIQMFHIFLVIVLKVKEKKLPYLYWAYFATIFIPPAAVTTIVFILQHQGYNRGYIGCFTTEDAGDADIWYLFFPMFVVGCIGMLLMMCVIYRALQWMSVAHDHTSHESHSNLSSGAASLNASQASSPRGEEKKPAMVAGTSSTALVSSASNGDGALIAHGADVGHGSDKGTAVDVENIPASGPPPAANGTMSPVPEETKSPNQNDFSLGMLSPTTRRFFNDISSPLKFVNNKVGISGEEFTPPNAHGNKRPRSFFSSPGTSPVKKISRMLELDTSFLVKIKALQAPLWFVGVFMFCLCGLVVGRFEAWRTQDNRTESFDDWVACVFSNYDGSTDSSWISACGKQAEYTVNFHIGAWFAFTVLGHSLFITLSYLRMGDLIAYFREMRKQSKEKAKKERLLRTRSSFSRKSFSQNQVGLGGRQVASEVETSGDGSGTNNIVSTVRRTVVSFIRVRQSSDGDEDDADSFVEVIEERDRSEIQRGNSNNFMSEENSRSGMVIFSDNGNMNSDVPSEGYCDSGSASVIGDDMEMLDLGKKQSSFSCGKTVAGKPSPLASSASENKFSSPPRSSKVSGGSGKGIAVRAAAEDDSLEHLDTGTYREVLMNSSGFINMNETTRKLIQDSLHEVSQNRRGSGTGSVKSPLDLSVSNNASSVTPGSEVQPF